MALRVIGAGFGRTGTESMKRALEMIGFGPCYHMSEVAPHPERIALWRRAASGAAIDWDETFSGFAATVDWPAAYFWRELADHYPDAKILLTARDPESWFASMEKTIFSLISKGNEPDSFGEVAIARGTFGGHFDKDHAIAVFTKHIVDVQAAFPPKRLLTFNVGDGWEPLCRFLGQPVPDQPFPHTNRPDAFHEAHDRNRHRSDR